MPRKPKVSNGIAAAARAAIGGGPRELDWRLRPQDHADALPPQAQALARVLRHPQAAAVMHEFAAADTKADAAQTRYKSWARRAIWLRFAATAIGLAALLPAAIGDSFTHAAGLTPQRFSVMVQFACLALAFAATGFVNRRKLYRRWMVHRAEAEMARAKLFAAIVEAEESPGPGELPALPLKLAYFGRYQLDVQIAYYARRGAQHMKAGLLTRRAGKWLRALAYISVIPIAWILASLWFSLPDTETADNAFLAFGSVASALFSALAGISQMNLDDRNAYRYLAAAGQLKSLKNDEWAGAEAAAVRGNAKAVRTFVARAQDTMTVEHREWQLIRDELTRGAG